MGGSLPTHEAVDGACPVLQTMVEHCVGDGEIYLPTLVDGLTGFDCKR